MSIVSASRFAGLPHFGHGTLIQSSAWASGGLPFGLKSSTWGSTTGSSLSGTGTIPSVSQ